MIACTAPKSVTEHRDRLARGVDFRHQRRRSMVLGSGAN